MIENILQFLLHVAASTIGILVGAWLARVWEEYWRSRKWRIKK